MMYFILIESFCLIMIVYILFLVLFKKNLMFMDMMSCYECGFDCISFTRLVFSYRFFLISILFIIFDVEISLMVAIPFYMMSDFSVVMFLMFIFILLIGLIYEYGYGSLDWLNYYISK